MLVVCQPGNSTRRFRIGSEVNLHSTHRRDIKTEQTTSDDGDGRDEVDIAKLSHVGRVKPLVVCKRQSLWKERDWNGLAGRMRLLFDGTQRRTSGGHARGPTLQ